MTLYWQYLKPENPKVRQRLGVLCLSEIIFIDVCYKYSQLHHFKAIYGMMKPFYSKLSKALPSSQRMIYLINQHQLQALHILLLTKIQTQYPWVSYTIVAVFKNQRIQRHKSLKQIATRGKIQWIGSMDVNYLCCWMLKVTLFRFNSRIFMLQM